MKPAIKTVISLGFGALVQYLTTAKPLRTWLRKRKPTLDHKRIDELAQEAIEAVERKIP